MFSNPLGQMFGKPDEPEKKKKRGKRNKKLSPEASEDTPSSLNGSNTDLKASVTFEEVQADAGEAPKCSGLLDIVNEINSAPLVEEPVEEIADELIETQYEERTVDEITIKAVLEGMQNQNEQQATGMSYLCFKKEYPVNIDQTELISGFNPGSKNENEIK